MAKAKTQRQQDYAAVQELMTRLQNGVGAWDHEFGPMYTTSVLFKQHDTNTWTLTYQGRKYRVVVEPVVDITK